MKRANCFAALFICLAISAPIFGAPELATHDPQIAQWLSGLDHPRDSRMRLQPENVLAQYEAYDFAPLLKPRSVFLGYIGADYQRLHITFTSIERDPSDKQKYLVKGVSGVKANFNNFEGTITLDSIREYTSLHYGADDELKSAGIKSEGTLVAHYELVENPTQPHGGTFGGIVTLYWYVDKDGKLKYDDIMDYSDGYSNNQYVGNWTSYATGKRKVANWGEYRIPFSGDLDYGAGEFGPNPKYKNKGWADYDANHPDE